MGESGFGVGCNNWISLELYPTERHQFALNEGRACRGTNGMGKDMWIYWESRK